MKIERLPDRYHFGEWVRIGPRIYRVALRVKNWHWLIPTY